MLFKSWKSIIKLYYIHIVKQRPNVLKTDIEELKLNLFGGVEEEMAKIEFIWWSRRRNGKN